MAIIALLQSGNFNQTTAWSNALRAAGHVVVDYSNGIPSGAAFDIGLFLNAHNPINVALASGLAATGKSIISSGSGTGQLPFTAGGLGSTNLLFGPNTLAPTGTHPLAVGWGAFDLKEQTSSNFLAWQTSFALGVQVIGVYAGDQQFGEPPNGTPLYVLAESTAPQFWLNLQPGVVPPAGLVAAAAQYVTTRYAASQSCSATVPCPAGLVCQDGVCGPCSNLAPCPTGYVCQNGLCVVGGGPCSPTVPCPMGQTCTNGVCVAGCPAGQISLLGLCVPWWILAIAGVGALLLVGGGGGQGEHAAPRHRRRLRHARPRVVTRTRTVERRISASEASDILRHRDRQLHPASARSVSEP